MAPESASDNPGGGRATQEDSRLVQEAVRQAQLGDPDAVHFLYARFAPEVRRYIDSLVDDHHEAEDITQAVFGKLSMSIGEYQQHEGQFGAWILRVARNDLQSRG